MHLCEAAYHDPEDDDVATPESCSWATSEKACSNDNNPNFPGDQGRYSSPHFLICCLHSLSPLRHFPSPNGPKTRKEKGNEVVLLVMCYTNLLSFLFEMMVLLILVLGPLVVWFSS